jgi:hypothetical protein
MRFAEVDSRFGFFAEMYVKDPRRREPQGCPQNGMKGL